MIPPEEPFLSPINKRWIPTEMTNAPPLDDAGPAASIEPNYALAINPFYPDPNVWRCVSDAQYALPVRAARRQILGAFNTGTKTCWMDDHRFSLCHKSSALLYT
jgi:hypothetical protein